MNKYRRPFFYITTIGVFSLLMYWIVVMGSGMEAGRNVIIHAVENNHWMEFMTTLSHNLAHPLAILLAQIVTIILVARFFGWICKRIGQPMVIGEIVAGIVLGPSLLGNYFPGFFDALFPAESLGNLQFISQFGLILFMFVIGMELNLKVLRHKAADAFVISHSSIIIPFVLGMGLAYFIYSSFAPEGVRFLSFGLFLGISMSITAFPVLARIVQERGIYKTRMGNIVILCAAFNDITAWCLLAALIAIVKAGTVVSTLYIIALAALYVVVMILVVRPFLKRIGELHNSKESMSKSIVAIFFLVLIISSYATQLLGIHALFGAFMAGAIMPDNVKFRNIFIEKVEDVALVLLLPLFFVYTGLRTQVGLLNEPHLWGVTGIIVLVAVAGKFLGSAAAARYVGQSWKESLTIGALMNTRGLMELVALNIGYDLGVLSPEIFTMIVLMALITTFMTGPALNLIDFLFRKDSEVEPGEAGQEGLFRILISFANPDRGRSLVRLANALVRKIKGENLVTVMHLSPYSEAHMYDCDQYESDCFTPVIREAKELNQKIITLFKATNDVDSDMTEMANKGDFDLLLVGIGQSIFQGSLLGRILGFTTRIINPDKLIDQVAGKQRWFENSPFDERTRMVISRSRIPVGILIDKGLQDIGKVFMPMFFREDIFLIDYARKFISNASCTVTIPGGKNHSLNSSGLREAIHLFGKTEPEHVILMDEKLPEGNIIQDYDLMLVSLGTWKHLVNKKSRWLSDIPSTLIIAGK